MVNFETGWTLTGSKYMDWAKGSPFNLDQVANDLDVIEWTPFVPTKYLEKEKDTRARLVNHISGMDMLETLTSGLSELPAAASFSQAISRHFLPPLKEYTLEWLNAKLDVRKYVLQGASNAASKNLLISNL